MDGANNRIGYKMKDFKDHRIDIQKEYRSGDHRIIWSISSSSGIEFIGKVANYEFYLRKCKICVVCSQDILFLDTENDGVHALNSNDIQRKRRSTTEKDKNFCQDYYLDWLARRR